MHAESGRLAPGATLGAYRLERLLGRGGMGAVYLAYDTTLHRHVALKTLDAPADDAGTRARLVREARNAAALNHQHICTIHEVGEADGSAFIAMEYVDGLSLRERIDAGAVPLDEAVRLGIQAADALAYAHARGVIHRDFKAANAIVTSEGRLKVVDFGLARREDALLAGATTEMSLVPAGAAAGTPYAMAPEQVRGEAADARTDIWALGVLLSEMVSRRKPFEAPTVAELFSAILTQAPAALPRAVPAPLGAVIERCLAKAPAQRYQGATEVRAALEAVQSGLASAWVTWRYRVRRRPLTAAAAALVALMALGVGANVGGVRDRLAGTPPPLAPIKLAVLPFENLTGDPEQEYLSDGLTDEMIGQLGRLHPARLSVIARTSSMRYKDRVTPLDQIGRELGVDYLLEGSARREGSRLRINATLIHVSNQTQRWSDSFDRELESILSLQHDVARGVAGALALALLPEEQVRLARARSVNPEAYEAYLRGQSHARRLTRGDLDRALEYYELALEKDPDFALAHFGVGGVWAGRVQMGFVTRAEAGDRGRTALMKALAIDDSLPEVHLGLANGSTWAEWDWPAAAASFRRALDLNPNHAEARAFYAHYLYIMLRPAEAALEMQRALMLDPLNELIQLLYSRALRFERRYDEAIAHAQGVLSTDPNAAFAWGALSESYHVLGRFQESLETQRRVLGARGDAAVDEGLTRGYAAGGYRQAMRLAADERAARMQARVAAIFYLRAGERDLAAEWLERAHDQGDQGLPYISVDPIYDGLRDHPRFHALLQRMNLPQATAD
jgi:eukaryotic-like serine/threonine-protein kinase